MAANPYSRYQEQAIMTMTPGEMVVRLYEEVINQLNRGILSLESGNLEEANTALQKCQRIFKHLLSTLNQKYEVSQGLFALYNFFNSRIIDGNIRKSSAPLQEILPLVIDLKDAFAQAEKKSRMQCVID